MLQSPRFNEKNPLEINFFTDKEYENQLIETTDLQAITEILSPIKTLRFQALQSSPIKTRRIKKNIQVDAESLIKRKKTFKGLKDDTTELNTNFKTILSKKLKQLISLKEVSSDETEPIQSFLGYVPSFSGLKILKNS